MLDKNVLNCLVLNVVKKNCALNMTLSLQIHQPKTLSLQFQNFCTHTQKLLGLRDTLHNSPYHTTSQLRSVIIFGLSGTKLNSKVLNEVNNTYHKPNIYHSF